MTYRPLNLWLLVFLFLPLVSSPSSLPSEYAEEVTSERWVVASLKIRQLLEEPDISELERVVYACDLAMVERRKGDAEEGLAVLKEELPAEVHRRARPQLEFFPKSCACRR